VVVHCRVRAVTRVGAGLAAIGQATPVIPSLSGSAVALLTSVTGAAGDVSVNLTTNTSLRPGELVAVVFPGGFDVSGALLRAARLGAGAGALSRMEGLHGACGYMCSSATPVVHLAFSSVESLPAGASISVVLGGVVNRKWAGGTGTFQIKTLSPTGNFTIDEALNISGSLLLPGLLPAAALSLADPHTGRLTTATVTFATSDRNPLPFDARIRLIYPSELTLDGGTQVDHFRLYVPFESFGPRGALALILPSNPYKTTTPTIKTIYI
jgi:hypothetical protein